MDNIAIESAVYTPKDLQEILQISKSAVYTLLTNAPFPIIKIGKIYRIPKHSFDIWLNSKP